MKRSTSGSTAASTWWRACRPTSGPSRSGGDVSFELEIVIDGLVADGHALVLDDWIGGLHADGALYGAGRVVRAEDVLELARRRPGCGSPTGAEELDDMHRRAEAARWTDGTYLVDED
jgi:hypothetical protein